MLNLTRYRPDAGYVRASRAGVNSLDPDNRYAPLGVLASIGATLCFVADVVASPGNWHRMAVVGYPSRRAFVEMAARQDFRDWHVSKSAEIDPAAAGADGACVSGTAAGADDRAVAIAVTATACDRDSRDHEH
jgi:hypothetical protein